MDQSVKILKGTKAHVEHDLALIGSTMAGFLRDKGYMAMDCKDGKGIAGKNAMTGETMPDILCMAWDMPRRLPNGDWYIMDPLCSPRFADWQCHIAEQGSLLCQRVDYSIAGVRDEAERSSRLFNLKTLKNILLSFFQRR